MPAKNVSTAVCGNRTIRMAAQVHLAVLPDDDDTDYPAVPIYGVSVETDGETPFVRSFPTPELAEAFLQGVGTALVLVGARFPVKVPTIPRP